MAVPSWTSAALAAYETTYKAADKPILGNQATPITPTTVRWNTAGTVGGTDVTASGYPTARAYDGLPAFATKPNAAGVSWYLVYDFGTAGAEFDSFLFIGHNLGTGGATLQLQLDNGNPNPGDTPDGTFANVVTLLNTGALTDDTRYAAWDLHHTGAVPLRYSDVRYARILITAASFTPELNEVIFCRRRQLKHNPNLPYDDYRKGTLKEVTETNSGMVLSNTRWKGRYELVANLNPHETTYINDLKAWDAGRHYGRSEFIWCPLPYSAGQDFYLMTDPEGGAAFPFVGPTERTFSIEAVEQGPEDYYLATEG